MGKEETMKRKEDGVKREKKHRHRYEYHTFKCGCIWPMHDKRKAKHTPDTQMICKCGKTKP